MFRRAGMVCAGTLVVAFAGCALQFGNTAVELGVKVNEQLVTDALDHVADRIQREMERLGLQVIVNHEVESVRLTSTTKGGQKFVVVLSRVQGRAGEQTRLHIDWDQGSDKALWLQLLLVAGPSTATRT